MRFRTDSNSIHTDGYADILTDLPAWQRAELKLPPVPEHEMDTLPPCQLNKSIPCDTAGEEPSSEAVYKNSTGADLACFRTFVVDEVLPARFRSPRLELK